MEDQNVTWKDGSMYVPNYFTGANGVPIQSVPIFPQFPNQIASTFPQFFPNQGASIFPQFPRADNFPSHSSSVGYGRAHNVPHHTPVSIHNIHITNYVNLCCQICFLSLICILYLC
jgi:hypothetical protein